MQRIDETRVTFNRMNAQFAAERRRIKVFNNEEEFTSI